MCILWYTQQLFYVIEKGFDWCLSASNRLRGLIRSVWVRNPGPWRRHQMETFSALLAICAGNSQVTGEFPAQRPVTQSFDVFFDMQLSKWLSKQWWGWWFEMPSRPLWRHYNAKNNLLVHIGGLAQERRNSSALAMELRFSWTTFFLN